MIWKCRDFSFELNRTLVMGIVNVTPDSFSDGGKYFRPEEAVRRVRNCLSEGADIIDLGGESTRPGATPLTWQDEWARLEPVLDALRADPLPPLSIDTYHPETAERALAKGAAIINCVYPEPMAAMAQLARQTGAGVVVPYRIAEAEAVAAFDKFKVQYGFAGIEDQLMIDPMVGFGTTREEDMALMGSLRRLAALAPVLMGVSRKRLIKKLVGAKSDGVGKNLGGCLGAAVWCAMAGAAVVRVHDVRETVQALKVVDALAGVTDQFPSSDCAEEARA
ncbi:MAG: dihydropteroate synthase [Kiritimatiellae bacterium]|nr:dihydropteroate synthase [Kiritimatiellia bacterium]